MSQALVRLDGALVDARSDEPAPVALQGLRAKVPALDIGVGQGLAVVLENVT